MREEGKGKREKGRGILWLMLAAAVVVAVVVIVIVVGRRAPSPHDSSDRFAAVSPVDNPPQGETTGGGAVSAPQMTKALIAKTLRTFMWRFFMQAFKRNCQPDGIRVFPFELSLRGWWIPSDLGFVKI